MIIYNKLFAMLAMRSMKRTDLLKPEGVVSSPTLAKLGKNEKVSIDIIDKLCNFLDCQPGDLMQFVPDERAESEK
jgi:DNA-binding Xre family transcriptional regulator